MRRLLRVLPFLLLALFVVAVIGYVHLRQSLPQTEGSLAARGLEATVEILRDRYGIPHIFAASERDAQFALGFVHAQDRLWQMEINRRIGAGRLAEVLGPTALDSDRFMRTLGVRRIAEANVANLDPHTRTLLDAYAAGVNAFLDTRPVLPPEFLLFGVRPEPWSAADSVSWVKLMALDLDGNWRNELLRAWLARSLAVARIHEFLPPYPGEAPAQLPDLGALYAKMAKMGSDPIFQNPKMGSDPIFAALSAGASNAWAVARGARGGPLLANDPHLGLTAPSLWYLAHLQAPGLEAIGATLPGVPGIVLGRNARIAWGITNTGADVQDLYLERVAPDGNFLTPEGPRPFRVIEERIAVRGGEDEVLRVRLSRHGPVISDVAEEARRIAPPGHVVALAWTALLEEDATLRGALALARARDWREFLAAAADFHSPALTMVYADADGRIGTIAAGRVPRRKAANDLLGLAPAPGWDARYDWDGFLPFEDLPREVDPAGGRLIAANHRIIAPDYRHHITTEWQPPYRARRIDALLKASAQHDLGSFARIQLDVVSLAVRELLPHFLRARPRSREAHEALALLNGWDGTMALERPEPLLFTAWWRELTRALYADELGAAFLPHWQPRPLFVAAVLGGAAPAWCNDIRTPQVETCEQLLSASLEAALADLRRRYGRDMRAWQWGEAHFAQHRHRPLSRNRWAARFVEIRVPTPGGAYTVNVGRSHFADEVAPFANRHAASYRALYDLAEPQASLFIHSGGQSGNRLSPHYRTFTDAWARGDYIRMVTDRARLEAAGVARLVLTPQ